MLNQENRIESKNAGAFYFSVVGLAMALSFSSGALAKSSQTVKVYKSNVKSAQKQIKTVQNGGCYTTKQQVIDMPSGGGAGSGSTGGSHYVTVKHCY